MSHGYGAPVPRDTCRSGITFIFKMLRGLDLPVRFERGRAMIAPMLDIHETDTEIVSDKVAAAFKNGVLTVTPPKKPEARKHFKRVPIHHSGEEKKMEKKAA